MNVDWVNERSIPPLTATLELPPVDRSTPAIVSHGEREDDPDTQAALVRERLDDGRRVWFRYIPQRRARYTTWYDSSGQRWGKRTWEHCSPRLEALPD